MHKAMVIVLLVLITHQTEGVYPTPAHANITPKKLRVEKDTAQHPRPLTFAYFNSAVKGRVRNFSQLDRDSVQLAEEYPFDLYAVTLKTKNLSQLKHQMALAGKSKKQFWPKIFVSNALIKSGSGVLDVWDAEATSDALNFMTASVRLAVLTNADGVFLDFEAYHNRKNYNISYISRRTGRSTQQVIKKLKEFGTSLADSVQKQSHGIPFHLWLTFADFQRRMQDGYHRSTNYIVEGLLDRIVQKHYDITIIEGGQVSIGYVHLTPQHLAAKIKRHKQQLSPWVKKYAPHFILSGTMVLFKDYSDLGFWNKYLKDVNMRKNLLDGKEKDSREVLSVMLENYTHVWIYWGGNPIFDVFDRRSKPIFGPILRHALERSTTSLK
jgi:hypothetical protein